VVLGERPRQDPRLRDVVLGDDRADVHGKAAG
jgi:hypothetical protein